MHLEIPVDPAAPDARRWLQDELAKPEYQAAQPNWFDQLMVQIRDWFLSLFDGAGGIPPGLLLLVVVLGVVGLAVVALLVFGLPRFRHRAVPVALFDDGDVRDLRTLRRAADAAVAAGDWPLAIEERFRAIVRSLVDRDLVRVDPGTTAHGVSSAASRPFPAFAADLASAADAFDGVRYLGRPGDRDASDRMTRLDRAIEGAMPASSAPVVESAAATSHPPAQSGARG